MEKETKRELPGAFVEKMEKLLGSDAETFFKSYDAERKFGLRVNPLKLENGEILDPESPLGVYLQGLPKVPWAKEGFYYEAEMRPGRHPFHETGAYYIQEPSAMSVAEALAPGPGERILDLCAAPGGKSTHLAGKMGGKGLLVCNEIHPARAKILSQNIERLGVGNAVVTNMDPFQLAPAFPEFFDGIVVDAPCSGEGMFRKDENARNEWSPDHVKQCAGLQDGILDCAAKMLKDGGRIAYSTCTFSPEENEQRVARFLSRHPEFSVIRPAIAEYFSAGHPEWADGNPELEKTVRIWPHMADGEGHFLALLVKGENGWDPVPEEIGSLCEKTGAECAETVADEIVVSGKRKKSGKKDSRRDGQKNGRGREDAALSEAVSAFRMFEKENLKDSESLESGKRFLLFGENLYLVPEQMPDLKGLKVLRPGLHLGTSKKDRFEPSHALALFLKRENVKQAVEVGTEDLALRYLRGETLRAEDFEDKEIPAKGWVLVTTGGMSLGFAKAAGGMLKNHYPKGLRIQGG